jgi:hypothetical protein
MKAKSRKQDTDQAGRTWKQERATVAALSRDREPDDPQLLDARERLRVARQQAVLDAHIAALVAEAPALTPEQRDKLAILFSNPMGKSAHHA